MLDPEAPPYCTVHKEEKACCVLRPCDHFACTTCVGKAMMTGVQPKCGVVRCDKMIDTFVGFKKPMAKVNVGAGSDGNWWEVENQIDGMEVGEMDDNVVTLMLDGDKVSRLHGNAFQTC